MPTTKTYSNGVVVYKTDNDILHRTDGPAMKWPNGDYYWYKDGKLHRTDGPAWQVGAMAKWYFDGVEVSQEITDKYFADPVNPTADEIVIMKMHETFKQ